MLRFRSSFINGVQDLVFIHGLRQLALYSTSISTEVNPNFVNYLVQTLGLSRQQALSISSYLTLKQYALSTKNVESIITFLKNLGLKQSHIRHVVVSNPHCLSCNVEKTLIPKIEGLQKLGFSRNDIAEVVSLTPRLLFKGFDTTIVPTIEALREIMGCEAHVIQILKKLHFTNITAIPKYLVSNVALLRSHGVPLESIRRNILKNSSVFVRRTDGFMNAVTKIEEKLGIPRNSPQFFNGYKVVSSLSDKTIESKLLVYKSFGWTDAVITTHISTYPLVLTYSNDNIREKLDFWMNEMGYKPSYLASKSNLFGCSLEKRIVPRHNVLLVLKENGLMTTYSLPTVVNYTESKFLNKFVLPFKEVHEVYSKSAGINLEMLPLELSKPNSSAL